MIILTKNRVPFLLVILVSMMISCNQLEKHGKKFQNNAGDSVSYYITKIGKSKNPQTQLQYADKAYQFALKSDSYVFWDAFQAKYQLIKSIEPHREEQFLSEYESHAKKKRDTLNTANAFYEKGKFYDKKGNSVKAFKNFNDSKLHYQLLKDSLQIAEKLLHIADIHREYNDYIGVEMISTEALGFLGKSLKTNIDTAYASIIYNNLGMAFSNLRNDSLAIASYENGLKLARNIPAQNVIKNNQALVYIRSAQFEKALALLKPIVLLEIAGALGETDSRILDNFGNCKVKSGDLSGLTQIHEAHKSRIANNDSLGLIASNLHLAEFHANKSKNLAIKFSNDAYQIATDHNSINDRLLALELLRSNSHPLEREKYSEIYIALQDSIVNVRQQARNQFAKLRYDSRLIKEENANIKAQSLIKNLQAEQQEMQKLIAFSFVIFLIIVGALLYFLIQRRHQKQQINGIYETETRIAKKVHDELANDIYHALTYITTQDLSDVQKKETLVNNLDSIYGRTRDISRENNPIDTGDDFPENLREMLSEFSAPNLTVLLKGINDLAWSDYQDQTKMIIYRVLQELMVNMKKHSQASIAAVRFESDNKLIQVHYSDNGIGITAGKRVFKNGLQNVENRIKAIGGSFTFDLVTDKGLKITISCPSK